jgi:uncharacterized protein
MTDTSTEHSTAPAGGSPVTWFEIGTDDPAGARAFYGAVFGWTYEDLGTYSTVTTGDGHTLQGGIQDTTAPLPEGQPAAYAVPVVQVPDVAAACRRAEAAGGKVLVGATPTPMGLVYGMIADRAGNRVGVWTPPAG